MPYKHQIEQELLRKDWEIDQIRLNTAWWDDENWKVCFKYNTAIYFYLCFIVDPMFEGNRKKGQGIYEIKAVTIFPKNWNDDTNIITAIQMSKRKFNLKLQEFIHDLENYKMETLCSQNRPNRTNI